MDDCARSQDVCNTTGWAGQVSVLVDIAYAASQAHQFVAGGQEEGPINQQMAKWAVEVLLELCQPLSQLQVQE
ncbi:MAG: hypothetical protein A6F71_08275 [Cycloclasticus sp. symbiont of Poecilosclerida sp. M]|nr:MAG: hypothetical protein A6F71_08275 [Cycloclasticus sp. symbiont of Poecilosclerida sp. M]